MLTILSSVVQRDVTASVIGALEHETAVRPAKCECIDEHTPRGELACHVRDVVEIALRIGMLVVDCRRDNMVGCRARSDEYVERPGGACEMARHRLVRADC